MSLLDLNGVSAKGYKSSPKDYSKYLIIGVVIIGFISAMAITIPPFVATTCGGPVCGMDGKNYDSSCSAALAFVAIKNNGTCLTCSDEDGINEFISASAVSTTGTLKDVCVDSSILNEAVCEDGVAVYSEIPCALGYECSEGACNSICLDSDEGIDLKIKGTVILGNSSELMDECISDSVVKEYYCENNTIISDEFECEFGSHCTDGACVENPCADSDGGKEINIFGTITKGKDSYSDTCEGILKIKEYYCNEGEIDYEITDCLNGFECKNGVCQEMICVDSDSGLNQYIKGTTTFGVDTFTDSCYNDYTVLEYFCMNNSIKTTTLTCGSGSECNDGLCKVVNCQKTEKSIDLTDSKYVIGTYNDDVDLDILTNSIVEIKSGYLLEVVNLENLTATFALYKNIEEYRDGEDLCEFSINKSSSLTKYCGKTITPIKVVSLNDTTGEISLEIDVFYAVQYYNADGFIVNWTDSVACSADEVSYNEFGAEFFPYLDADSDMEFKTKKIQFLDDYATIKDIDLDDKTLRIIFGSKTYTFEDGDTFEYKDVDYMIDLEFNELGLTKLIVEED